MRGGGFGGGGGGGRGGGEVVKKRESLPILDLQSLASMIMSVFNFYDNVPRESGFKNFLSLGQFIAK